MGDEAVRLTSDLFWRATLVTGLIDLPLLALVARGVPPRLFASLKWPLATAAFLVYAGLWLAFGSVLYWDAVYRHVFPGWSRWLLPPWMGTLFGAAALLFWRLSVNAPRWPAVRFALLGGLVSLVGHGIGIRRGLMRVPLLAHASPASALAFGVTEFIVYWCAIVALAGAGHGLAVTARRRETARRG